MITRLVLALTVAVVLAGCDDSSKSSDVTAPTSTTATQTTLSQASADSVSIDGNPTTAIKAGETYMFQPAANSTTGNSLSFSIQNKPDWADFDTATGILTGIASENSVGTFANILITVSDGIASASVPMFTITVNQPAQPGDPTITGAPRTSIVVDTAYYFKPTATSPAGSALTFTIQNKPTWASFNTVTGELSGTATTANLGTSTGIIISASDGSATSSLPAFSILVIANTTTPTPVPTPVTPTPTPVPTPVVPTPTPLPTPVVPTPTPVPTPTSPSGTVSISGTPTSSLVVGKAYSFVPTASESSGATLTFAIANKPSWATFNVSTGALSGTPTAADIGTTSGIVISASKGTETATLPAFSIAVTQIATGSATLNWMPPTQNTDGTALTNLAGYNIYYGTSKTAMNSVIKISGAAMTTDVISNLSPATYYFSIVAYNASNVESTDSNIVSKTIQ